MTCLATILSPEQTLDRAVEDLPADCTRAPQHQFTAERQAAFLSRLAECGSARSAARAAQVSHQTAYRQRRACLRFRRAWDAALLVARAQAEEVLACRAIDGVEEEVWFRGEVVGTRRRYDTRLLLAHLARLDRLAEDADAAALSHDFETVLAAVEEGGALPPVPEPARHEASACAEDHRAAKHPSGPCNTRSKSPAEAAPEPEEDDEEPCVEERWAMMEAARPRHAPHPDDQEGDIDLEVVQFAAFEEGLDEWWTLTTWDDLEAALDLLEEQEAAEAKTSPAAPA